MTTGAKRRDSNKHLEGEREREAAFKKLRYSGTPILGINCTYQHSWSAYPTKIITLNKRLSSDAEILLVSID